MRLNNLLYLTLDTLMLIILTSQDSQQGMCFRIWGNLGKHNIGLDRYARKHLPELRLMRVMGAWMRIKDKWGHFMR